MIKSRGIFFLFGFLFLAATAAIAQYPVIAAEQLRSQMAAKKITRLIDSRTAEEYTQGHIPGAINIMPDHVKSAGARLPENKAALMVFYCRGVN